MSTSQSGRSASLAVLLVDDEPRILRAYARHLRRHRVTTASGLGDVVELLAAGYAPDVVLADYRLRDGTGVEVLTRVARACPGTRRVLMASNPDAIGAGEKGVAHAVYDKLSPGLSEVLARL